MAGCKDLAESEINSQRENRGMKFKQGAMIAQMTLLAGLSASVWAYDSGSTEVDGSFTPVVNTELMLPADGIFNFSNVDIPAGVTVTFAKNAANTPVILLASGNVNIDGSINVTGGKSADVGSAGDGNSGDDGLPGVGGPGGFNGGQPGIPGDIAGSAGLGPGGGNPAMINITNDQLNFGGRGCGGEGGSFTDSGKDSRVLSSSDTRYCNLVAQAKGSLPYGSSTLLPLIGGSGGGGASGGEAFSGSGGGGGGGALLIAASGTVTIVGSINANGGDSGASNGGQAGGSGGGGAGGAIRVIATTIEGNGAVTANGGLAGSAFGTAGSAVSFSVGGEGSVGRIRFEAETFTRTAATTPAFTFAQPDEIFLAGMPALSITSVAGVTAPAVPTGNSDIVLPEVTPNPVTVIFATTGVPLGNTVTLRVIPSRGETVTAVSSAISGTEASGTATASIDIPSGPSTLAAEISYTVTVAMGEDLSRYTDGVMVASVRLTEDAINGAQTTLITVDGKEHVISSALNSLRTAT